jgi:hypothetical protein
VNSIEQLILDLKESLEREIRQVKGTVEQGVNTRFDTQPVRLEQNVADRSTLERPDRRLDGDCRFARERMSG